MSGRCVLLATLVTAEETATQVKVVFTEALDTEGLWPAVEARQAQRARRGTPDLRPAIYAVAVSELSLTTQTAIPTPSGPAVVPR